MRKVMFMLVAGTVHAGCASSPFPDSMSPTDLQQRRFNSGGQSLPYYDMNDGDNEDPCFDNAAYPNMQQPWWNSPGYEGG